VSFQLKSQRPRKKVVRYDPLPEQP
jgi:hypothetical protein